MSHEHPTPTGIAAGAGHDHDADEASHEGKPLPPSKSSHDAQRHMGAMEDNVVPVMPPVIGPAVNDDSTEEDHEVDPHADMTPG